MWCTLVFKFHTGYPFPYVVKFPEDVTVRQLADAELFFKTSVPDEGFEKWVVTLGNLGPCGRTAKNSKSIKKHALYPTAKQVVLSLVRDAAEYVKK